MIGSLAEVRARRPSFVQHRESYRTRNGVAISARPQLFAPTPSSKVASSLTNAYPLASTTAAIISAVAVGTAGAGGSSFYQFIYAGAIALGQPVAAAQALAISILTPFANVFADLSLQDEQERLVINSIISALQSVN